MDEEEIPHAAKKHRLEEGMLHQPAPAAADSETVAPAPPPAFLDAQPYGSGAVIIISDEDD